jgi:hypothetical protein
MADIIDASVRFQNRNRAVDVYEIVEKYKTAGHVFLALKHAGQDFPPTLTVAFLADGNEETADALNEGDKIEFTKAIHPKTRQEIRQQFFDNAHPALMISAIRFWRPNVIYAPGWGRLSQRREQQSSPSNRPRTL